MAKELDLRSAEYRELQFTPGSPIAAGEFFQLNDINGFPLVDLVSGKLGVLITKAQKVKAAKDTGVAVLAGEKAFFILASNIVTNVVGTNILIGHFVEDAVMAATEVLIAFDGELLS